MFSGRNLRRRRSYATDFGTEIGDLGQRSSTHSFHCSMTSSAAPRGGEVTPNAWENTSLDFRSRKILAIKFQIYDSPFDRISERSQP